VNPARRQAVSTLIMMAILLVFVVRLVFIQVIDAEALATSALDTRLRTVVITPPRGDIVDRNGVVLATSVDRYNITAHPKQVAEWVQSDGTTVVAQGPLDAALQLAPILGVPEAELAAALIQTDKSNVYLKKDVSRETLEQVAALQIAGLDHEPTTERIYPNGNLAGNVIGFMGGGAGTSDTGLSGIEFAYEAEMTGTPGEVTYERAAGNVVIPGTRRDETLAVAGGTVVTTIDRDIQWTTQNRIQQAIVETGAEWGIALVMNVKTGEIYALADTNTVDPTNPGASVDTDRGSRAVSAHFEPGSTSKLITAAAVLEEGLATPTSQYISPYLYTTPNNETFRDSHEHEDEKLTLTGIFVKSSNTGTIIAGEGLDSQTLYDYMSDFGFGEVPGIGLPGETAGILRDPGDWDGRTKYAMLFGQGVTVSAVHTADVYATVANDGMRVYPSIIKGIEYPDGTFEEVERPEPYRVVSSATSDQLMLMLEAVVNDGTGRLAQIPGYRVGGKTGTAQAADANGQLTSIVASFVGVAPADDPEIVVSIVLYNPKTSIWGGDVAAPVFKDVATFALQALRVPPSTGTPTLYPTTWE